MAAHDSAAAAAPTLRQRAREEFKNYLRISSYLAFFFCALVAYTRLILHSQEITSGKLNFAFAIINALVIGKIILLGDMVKLGRKAQARPLYQAVFVRAFLFSLLVLAFHFVEELVKCLIHHEPSETILHEIRIDILLARSIVIFCAFIPLFAFRELEHTLGSEKVHHLFFAPRTPPSTAQTAGN